MNLRPKHNVFKSDVFSLGVCFINVVLLESCDDLYNFNKYTINEMVLEDKIEKMKIQYPLELIKVIQEMVILDEKNRPDFNVLMIIFEEQKNIFNEKHSGLGMENRNNQDFGHDNNNVSTIIKKINILKY